MDIGKCGLYRYATDPSFEILLVAWATDEGEGFGETRGADLASGEPLPKELLEDFQSGNVRLIAHNASFERVCFSVHLQRHLPGQYLKPGEFLSPDSWICTMVMAASLTLPMALKDVGTVLKTCQQKDSPPVLSAGLQHFFPFFQLLFHLYASFTVIRISSPASP